MFVALNDHVSAPDRSSMCRAGVAVEEPIASDVQSPPAAVLNQRTLIVLEEGAQAEVWEQYLSGSRELDGVFNAVTELIVGTGARLRYVCGQSLSERSWIFGAQRAEVGRDATLDWVALGFGSANGRVRMETRLGGQGADARVTGAYATHGPSTSTSTRPRSTPRRTPPRTSPSAACCRAAPARSGRATSSSTRVHRRPTRFRNRATF